MILVIEDNADARLEQAYALRAKLLGDKAGWRIQVIGGKEMDELDDMPAVHCLYYSTIDKLTGYARLLPTTGPTLLERYFGDAFKERISNPTTWEVSKFCIDFPEDARYWDKAALSAIMMTGMAKLAWRSGIEAFTGIINDKTRRNYDRGGLEITIVEEAVIDGEKMFLMLHHLDRERLGRIAAWFGDDVMEAAELQHA